MTPLLVLEAGALRRQAIGGFALILAPRHLESKIVN
jgi:hypothetical protein